jgi:aryl-alcohol dehydrogenase-like predicted oxidoreductase
LPVPPIRALGNTGMQITTVGFGAWAIGGEGWEHAWGPQDDAESIATIRRAVAAGINWLDTAPIYGLGHSEELVGVALAGLPADERPYVFTKCGLHWDPAEPMGPQQRDARSIRWEVEQSLRRLRVARLDLLQVHWPPLYGPILDEYWQVMVDLKAAGTVRAIGLSNHDAAQVDAAEGIGHVDSLQPPLSLLRRGAADVIARCAARGTGVIVYSPMESGLLSGSFSAERVAALPANDWRRSAAEYTGERHPQPALGRGSARGRGPARRQRRSDRGGLDACLARRDRRDRRRSASYAGRRHGYCGRAVTARRGHGRDRSSICGDRCRLWTGPAGLSPSPRDTRSSTRRSGRRRTGPSCLVRRDSTA